MTRPRGIHKCATCGETFGCDGNAMYCVSARVQAEQDTFMATLDGQTLDEAMANAERDAAAYGWTRAQMREMGSRIRMHFAIGPEPVFAIRELSVKS